MREKAKELHRQKMEANKKGYKGSSLQSTGGFGSSSTYTSPVIETPIEPPKPSYAQTLVNFLLYD